MFLGSDGFFCFSGICKFGSFKNPFATIISLPELYFRFRKFILLLETKKVIPMNYDSSTSCWKPWRWLRFDLILTMRDIYINSNPNPITKFTSSSRSTEFKDILPWNISQIITNTIRISMRIVISNVMKQDIPFWVWWKISGNSDKNMVRICQWRENHCRTNISIRRKKKIQKSRMVSATVRDPSRKVSHLSNVIWDRKIITEFTRYISSTRIG